MKKKLEADLISIAHRILKIKNKSDINQLYLETQKLYEKLAVLKFVDENFNELKPTIGYTEIESQVETIFDKEENFAEEIKAEEITPIALEETVMAEEISREPEIIEATPVAIVSEIPEVLVTQPEETVIEIPVETVEETAEEIEEPVLETLQETTATEDLSLQPGTEEKPISDFKPAFQLEAEKEEPKEELKEETSVKPNLGQILFEDFGINYSDTQFVKLDSFEPVSAHTTPSIHEFKESKESVEAAIAEPEKPRTVPLNEKLAKGFQIDLNDRIAFTKNLFGNNTEDYSRVLNQLLTFDNYSEAQEFIETMVKPDYNNWEGKDDYTERFLGIVEKKFS